MKSNQKPYALVDETYRNQAVECKSYSRATTDVLANGELSVASKSKSFQSCEGTAHCANGKTFTFFDIFTRVIQLKTTRNITRPKQISRPRRFRRRRPIELYARVLFVAKLFFVLTWWPSNSRDKICSASNALIVVMPCRLAFKYANTGLRAVKRITKKKKFLKKFAQNRQLTLLTHPF